jgi:hypothetical protein
MNSQLLPSSAARRIARAALLLASLSAVSGTADADRVITHDNRVLSVKKAREKDGGYHLVFEHGEITLPEKAAVKAVEIEGDMADYVPQNEDEKAKLEQGYVKYRGKWLSKKGFEEELAREFEASRKRADDIAAHAEFSNAWSKETKHFVVNSNTSPEILEYYCDLLETYYDAMDKRFNIKTSPALGRTKMTVNIFKNRKDFFRVAQPGDSAVLGYFNRGTKQLNFYHNYSEPAQTEWVGLHECTHLLTYLIDPQYVPQIWLNEALADYFGSSEITRDKKGKIVIVPGALQADRLLTVQNAIKDGTDTKLDKLFDLTHDEFDGFQYAHAWAFIYFLNESSPKYKKAFDRFFKDLYTQAKGITYESVGVPAEFDKSGTGMQASPQEIRRVVLQYLGVKDLDALEKEWKTWIAGLEMTSPEQRFKRAYQAVTFGRIYEIDEKAHRLDREKTRKNAEVALADIDAALAAGFKDPRAHWTRYNLLGVLDRDDEAKVSLEAALAADPLNARYYWAMGQELYEGFTIDFGDEDSGWVITSDQKMKKPSEEAARYFGLATELAPDNESYRDQFKRMTDA